MIGALEETGFHWTVPALLTTGLLPRWLVKLEILFHVGGTSHGSWMSFLADHMIPKLILHMW